MRHILVMGMAIGAALAGGCALPVEDRGRDEGQSAADTPTTSAAEAREGAAPWSFSYDEGRQEVTARRGDAQLVYFLRDMGDEGARAMAAFRGYDGATWTIPSGDATEHDDETIGQSHDPLVNVPYPAPIHTPSVTGPGYAPPHGAGGRHGPPPGWDRASWGVACRVASGMAGIAGCAAITLQCATVSVITVAGMAIPCSLFVAAACTAVGGASTAYAEMCPK